MKNEFIASILIPAAGFGKRAGSPHAKELFLDPDTQAPLIERSLRLAAKIKAQAIVITRTEKTELINYLQKKIESQPLTLCLIDEIKKEWPTTLLFSKPYWSKKNLVLLPDTVFSPENILETLLNDLDTHSYSFGLFDPPEKSSTRFQTWGTIDQHNRRHCEKPQTQDEKILQHLKAWGVFGFQKEAGHKLLTQLELSTQNHEFYPLNDFSTHELTEFRDLTR